MVNEQELKETVIFERKKPDVFGDAHPKALLRQIIENGEYLMPLDNQHVVSSDQFDSNTLLQLFRLAAKFESNPQRFSTPLQGKILISAFYEPSTRTRLSFESAWHRLGGDIMSITDRSTTGIAKGESLFDVGEMFNNYGDCVVLRDRDVQSLFEMIESLRIPIINAGNGIDEHPTQAMADLYTIFKWRPELVLKDVPENKKIRIGVIGVPNMMRTVRSLLKIFAIFPQAFSEVIIMHDGSNDEIFDPEQLEQLKKAGLNVTETTKVRKLITELDVIYINSIAWIGDTYTHFQEKIRLDGKTKLKESAIVLHPLARGDELSTELDETQHNWYFAQARGAVFVRMALLTCLVQRAERVIDVI
ncbi:MAG: aspartate carbamoyltransferase [Proteobacteria bacterium]|nr:aspartate carbamoyltransferase [Pseudomonadota bacterium]NOG61423.1 aspartate carbamoyltransferase [Pseudomonadota bacterium]